MEKETNLIDEQRCTIMGNLDNEIIIHWRLWVLEKKELDERDHYHNLSRRQKSANTDTSKFSVFYWAKGLSLFSKAESLHLKTSYTEKKLPWALKDKKDKRQRAEGITCAQCLDLELAFSLPPGYGARVGGPSDLKASKAL